MRTTIINGQTTHVVGGFFSFGREVGNRLKAAYMGEEVSKWLEASFIENENEDYSMLAKHPDPMVRMLVARNLECLDVLRQDTCRNVSREATLIAAATGQHHLYTREHQVLWHTA